MTGGRLQRGAAPAYDAAMVLRTFCLAIVVLAACAGGENPPESSGFSGGAWTAPQTMPASASQVSGASEPTESDGDSGVTTDMIRPDFGSGESSTGAPDVTTGVDPTDVAKFCWARFRPSYVVSFWVIRTVKFCSSSS